MKSKKKLLTMAFLLVIIGIIFTVFYLKKIENKKNLSIPKPTEDRGQKEVEPSKKEEEREEEVKPQEENKPQEEVQNKEVIVKEKPKVVQKPKPTNKPQVNPQPKVQPKPNPTPQPKPKPTPTPQPKKELKPWEEVGLTEDQYKNKPMYSWERVDFKTEEECVNYGNTHAPFATGEGGYQCSTVNSWTRRLGYMFTPHYLKGK